MKYWKAALIVLALGLLGTQTLGQPVTVAVRVSLIDQEGHKLKNALVRAYAGNAFRDKVSTVAESRTNNLGLATLRVERGVLLKLRFDGPEESFPSFPSVMPNFKADRDSRIEQVILRSGLAYGTYDLLEILHALEFVYVLDESDDGVGVARNPDLKASYRRAMGMLKPLSGLTLDRYDFVKRLYPFPN